jgi:5'-nucleotidase
LNDPASVVGILTAVVVVVAVLDELLAAPARNLFNLNVPSVALTDLKGIRRGRISTAGIIKRAVGDGQGDRTLRVGESGMLALNLGSAVPELGDVSDEEPDDDGALVAAGYAALTALRGVHEDSDPGSDDLVRAAIGAIEQHLGARA